MIKIVQPLNNNVVMGYDRKKGEVIIIGTGIGFRAKKGDQVDESKIQKMFITGENKQLLEMIGAIPPEYFELVEEIFEKAKKEYGFLPKEKETLALLDHIHFAIKRMKENLVLDNPFETEIRQFYPKEWEIGLYAKKCIKRRFGIEIPDAEVGYIAMHIIASEFQKSRRTVSKTFEVIDLALKYIRDNYLTDVKEDSLAYTRLVTHVVLLNGCSGDYRTGIVWGVAPCEKTTHRIRSYGSGLLGGFFDVRSKMYGTKYVWTWRPAGILRRYICYLVYFDGGFFCRSIFDYDIDRV